MKSYPEDLVVLEICGSESGLYARWPLRLWLVVFLSFSVLWTASHFVALRHAWWYADDIVRVKEMGSWWSRGLLNGRPLESFWFLTFNLDPMPQGATANVLLRLLQSAVHVLNAVLVVRLLHRSLPSVLTLLAGLAFLLWCFNTEAALWRSGAPYVFAACFSMIAVLMLVRRPAGMSARLVSAALCALAMLTNQSAAMAGLCIWFLLISVGVHRPSLKQYKSSLVSSAVLLSGYLLGGICSIMITRFHPHDRAAMATSLFGKAGLWLKLQVLFWLFPGDYPGALQVINTVVLVALGLCVLLALPRRWDLALVALGGSVLPFLAVLLTAENSPNWRVMYLAPLSLVTLLAAAWEATRGRFRPMYLGAAVLVSILANAIVAYQNSSEYVRSFNADKSLAEAVDLHRRASGAGSVVVVDWRDVAPLAHPNLLNTRFNGYGGHHSAFLIFWASSSWLAQTTHTPVATDEHTVAIARAWCRDQPRSLTFVLSAKLPSTDAVAFCPR